MKWRDIEIDLLSGIDTKTDDRYVKGKLLKLENGQFPNPGRISKRPDVLPVGLTVLGNSETHRIDNRIQGVAHDGVHAVASHEQELLLWGDGDVPEGGSPTEYGPALFSRSQGAAAWRDVGVVQPVSLSVRTAGGSNADRANPEISASENYLMMVSLRVDSGVYDTLVSVIDRKTGATVLDELNSTTMGEPGFDLRAVYLSGPKAHVCCFKERAATNIKRFVVDEDSIVGASSISDSSIATNIANAGTAAGLDMVALNATTFVMAYHSSVPDIKVVTGADTGSLTTIATIAETPVDAISITRVDNDGTERLLVMYKQATTNNIRGVMLSTAGAVIWGPNTISGTAAGTVASITAADENLSVLGDWRVWFDEIGTNAKDDTVTTVDVSWDGALFLTGTASVLMGAALASKAYTHRGRSFVWTRHRSTTSNETQPTYFLQCYRTPYGGLNAYVPVVAKALYGAAGPVAYSSTTHHGISSVPAPEANSFMCAGLRHDRLVSDGVVLRSPVVVTTDMSPAPPQSAALGASHFSGGVVRDYAGVVHELGFHLHPENPARQSTGSGSIAAGDYSYVAVYEYTDRRGQVHRSSPSNAITVTQGASSSAVVRVPTLHATDANEYKATRIVIHLYRTAVGPGTIYYKCDANAANTRSAEYVDIEDTEADATLTDNEELYTGSLTNGVWDIPENIAPPASDIIAAGKNRLWCVPSEDRTLIWFSRQKTAGLGVEFNDSIFTKRVSAGGDITALSFLDEKVLVYKKNEIRYFVGEGPNNVGSGAFSEDYMVTVDVGCTDRNSVVTVPNGQMFKSAKGIYLLGRDLSVSYIGADVEAYNSYTVHRAVLLPKYHQVRFVLKGGPVLAFDYFAGAWSVYTDEGPYAGLQDGTVWQDEFTICGRGAEIGIYKETPATWNAKTSLLVETGWISLSGIQGFQRARELTIIGREGSPHTLNVAVFYDYNETAVQTRTFDSAVVKDGLYQWSYRLPRQKCEAVKFRVWDSDLSGSNEGYSINQMLLTVGLKRGPFRLLPTTKAV